MLGSHNAWSYLKPSKWYLKPFAFTAKCQSKNIEEQYNSSSRLFDLRIRFDKYQDPIICHGGMEYKYSKKQLESDLFWLNKQSDKIWIRIILDIRSSHSGTDEWQELVFADYCHELVEKYPNLIFTCGEELPSGKRVVELDNVDIPVIEKYSSVCPPKLIDDWIPSIYAKLNNKENIEKYAKDNLLIIDFI